MQALYFPLKNSKCFDMWLPNLQLLKTVMPVCVLLSKFVIELFCILCTELNHFSPALFNLFCQNFLVILLKWHWAHCDWENLLSFTQSPQQSGQFLCTSPATANPRAKWKSHISDLELQNAERFPEVLAPVYICLYRGSQGTWWSEIPLSR